MPKYLGSASTLGCRGYSSLSVWQGEHGWAVYVAEGGENSYASGSLEKVRERIDAWIAAVGERDGMDKAASVREQLEQVLVA